MNMIIATHSHLGKALLDSYEMIAGKTDAFQIISLTNEKGIDGFEQELVAILNTYIANNESVLILCDIPGGTPYNVSFRQALLHPNVIHVVSGVNLPMILELGLTAKLDQTASERATLAVESGIASIIKNEIDEIDEEELEF